MFSALFAFLGGNVFRMIWGEISHYISRKQDHDYELARLETQEKIDAAQHARNLESIRVQADLNIKVVEVQRDADIARIDEGAWSELVTSTTRLTGLPFIDYWNQSIRPFLATLAIAMVCFEIMKNGFVLTEWDRELFGAILGIFVADRQLSRRGK